ncbi:MAG: hypothetical protein HS109_05525 [Burkholderiales bacterium]|nr:hypothetical protein [Burkholderiales bacterium]MCE7877020.1 hypothetical protein [Betaproteobacteria bacterium PRO3]
MKARTLVSDRRYFGLDAVALRSAAARVASRIAGLAPERARVRGAFLRQDFGVDTVDGRALLDDLCAEGLLQKPADPGSDFLVTSKLVEYANARIVEPLPRAKAKLLVVRACELAERVNREWARNPLEIAAVALHGAYLSRDSRLDELSIALVVRARPSTRRSRFHQLSKADGAQALREGFGDLSSFVRVRLVTALDAVARPFSVAWQADDD